MPRNASHGAAGTGQHALEIADTEELFTYNLGMIAFLGVVAVLQGSLGLHHVRFGVREALLVLRFELLPLLPLRLMPPWRPFFAPFSASD